MKFLQLHETPGARPGPSLMGAMVGSAIGLSAVFAAGYSIWAFRLIRESALQYAAIAAVIFCLGGFVIQRAVVRRGAAWSFPVCFAIGFIAYAVLWSAAWIGLRGKYQADLIGAVLGLAALVWLWRRAFGGTAGFVELFLVLLVCHSIGYYLGGELHALVPGRTGKLFWGASHGLGFGAGMGFVLHRLQRPAKPAAGR
ncbi:MAG: hypothetical protein JNK23_24415 [Opitutaceae bacterium]|nr:hypothetical protein [Opitutaceae bacterium]